RRRRLPQRLRGPGGPPPGGGIERAGRRAPRGGAGGLLGPRRRGARRGGLRRLRPHRGRARRRRLPRPRCAWQDRAVPPLHAPHNGADDNASGVAAMLEAARLLGERRAELARDVWFVAFSAEEMGVIGSSAFVRRPPPGLALNTVEAMINLDMVGRLRENRL